MEDISISLQLLIGLVLGILLGIFIGYYIARLGVRKAEEARDKAILDMREASEKVAFLEEQLRESRDKTILLEAERNNLDLRIKEHKKDIEEIQKSSRLEFENISNKLFEEKSIKSQEGFKRLLEPFRNSLGEFHKEFYKGVGTIEREISHIRDISKDMNKETASLTKALRGDVKKQGNWGEMALKRLLEESGLSEGIYYSQEGKGLNLHNEDGKVLRPDFVIKLPEQRHIVIDSKVSLVHYDRYCASDDDSEKKNLREAIYQSLQKHIDNLSKYQSIDKINSPNFVLMFVPLEGVYMLASEYGMREDKDLLSYAWSKGVIIVCPSTLFGMLKTISSIWRLDSQNKNAKKIADEAGGLYDKIAGFVVDMEQIGKRLGQAEASYTDALKKLKTGRGSVIGRVEKLKVLGANTNKSLPLEDVED